VLAVATYLLARRWLGIAMSFCTAGLLLVNSWIVNYALQLKSYSYEALLTVVAVGLYLLLRRPGRSPAQLLGLYALLGLTCVFSLPNLFVVAPLLALDLVETLRAGIQVALRIAGEAVAAAIALVHYVAFVRPQAGIAGVFFGATYAPHAPAAFVRFAVDGLKSYIPQVITGVAGGARSVATPSYSLPPVAHHLLAVAIVLLLAAGVVAAVRDAAGRALVVAAGGALLLELIASAVHRWPFGLVRVNIFIIPLLYILAAMGAAWLARALRVPLRGGLRGGLRAMWWRVIALGAAAALLVVAGSAAGVATSAALAETSQLQAKPTYFGGTRAAVAAARLMAARDDLVIIRADRRPPVWSVGPWLYYMESYRGYPAGITSRPQIPARNTIAVAYVTPGAVRRFLAAHPGRPTIFLLEYDFHGYGLPAWAHLQSLQTLRRFGYCPVRTIAYTITGDLTVLTSGCSRT
jgi:hypothetical protein